MPIVSPKLGWMIDDVEIDPFNSDRMMYGTGATLYGTNNLTAWDTGGTVNISVMAKGIEELAILGLISPPSGAHLVSAVGDVAGFRHDDLLTPPSTSILESALGLHVRHRLRRAGSELYRAGRICRLQLGFECKIACNLHGRRNDLEQASLGACMGHRQ